MICSICNRDDPEGVVEGKVMMVLSGVSRVIRLEHPPMHLACLKAMGFKEAEAPVSLRVPITERCAGGCGKKEGFHPKRLEGNV